jgi:hypothetical protein
MLLCVWYGPIFTTRFRTPFFPGAGTTRFNHLQTLGGLTSVCGRVFGMARGDINLLCIPPAPLQARTGSSATLGRSNDNRSVVHHASAVLEAGWCPSAIPEHTQTSLVRGLQTPTVAPPVPVMSNGQPSRCSGQASIIMGSSLNNTFPVFGSSLNNTFTVFGSSLNNTFTVFGSSLNNS